MSDTSRPDSPERVERVGYNMPVEGDRPYNAPKSFGLVWVGELDYSSGSYEFDLTAVWWDPEAQTFRWADDSGCSCPSPFEDLWTLEEAEHGPLKRLREHLIRRRFGSYNNQPTYEEHTALLDRARAIQRGEVTE